MRFLKLASAIGVFCVTLIVTAQQTRAEITQKHRDVVQQVFERLIAVMDKPDGWEVWPPKIEVTDPGFANAFASYRVEDGIEVPVIEVTVTTIEAIANFDPDVLAFTIGHELGHQNFRHSHKREDFIKQYGDKLITLRTACGREEELEADLFGMQLALKAGYSRQGLLKDLQAWRAITPPYCQFEGLAFVHPPWEERAAHLLRGDQQESLWRSLSSFQTGVMFLENHHYSHAELCFRNVTKEFPECYEAWTNLGYALLMQYCDALEDEDLRALDVGHLVVGGFYRRPDSLEPDSRGPDEKIWLEAVGAFREALRLRDRLNLDDEMIMVKANLAVAYLVSPGGKDVGEAERWFSQVFKALEDPKKSAKLDPLVHASILINSGSARGFDGELIASALELIAKARKLKSNASAVTAMESALSFNQARAMNSTGSAEKKTVLSLYEKYLDGMAASSSWWPIAYQEYVQLAESIGAAPKEEKEFRQPDITDWRELTGVKLSDGTVIGLGEKIADVVAKLGAADVEIPVIERSNLKYYKYEKLGIKILATRDVLAVILESNSAPQITIQRPGLGGEEAKVYIDMNRGDLESLVGGEWDVELTQLFELGERHQLYRKLGLAAKFTDDRISELVVVVVPLAKQ